MTLLNILLLISGLKATPPPPSVAAFAPTILHQPLHQKKPEIRIDGHWEGTITQDYHTKTGTTRVEYEMQLDLNQDGKKITGVAYFVYKGENGKNYTAKMSVTGTFNKGLFFQYEEKSILQFDQIPKAEWCTKKAELIYKIKNDRPTLEGLWQGTTSFGGCVPGRIYLKKPPARV